MGFTVTKIHKCSFYNPLKKGDVILSFNGEPLIDYIDYAYFSSLKYLDVLYERKGEQRSSIIEKNELDPLGLEFKEDMLIKRTCGNSCVFCFVEQLPEGMRDTLYLKDEDWRYSFIMGNYVTMSTIKDVELERLCRRHASPLYLSVHTVDDELRRRMLRNKHAREIKGTIERLNRAGIAFHAQVVMCPGLNDGEVLRRTIEYLMDTSNCLSLAVVPVGLTSHREGLPVLPPVDRSSASSAIEIIEGYQAIALKKRETRFCFASDEMYIKANMPLPPYEHYEDFCQIENGVGMVALFEREVDDAIQSLKDKKAKEREVSVATGADFYPFMLENADKVKDAFGVDIGVYKVKNEFFGDGITVTGLLTGRDIAAQLAEKNLGKKLILTNSLLKEGSDVFLDDMHLNELERLLKTKIKTVEPSGTAFVEAVTGRKI